MQADFGRVYADVRAWAEARGVRVAERPMPAGQAGEFDSLSATMNTTYSAEERTYYLTHALGSIVRWSLSRPEVQTLFDELRDAKKNSGADPGRLEKAIERYRAFEVESSEFAVWLLTKLGHADVVAAYTNFMRADLEALTEFHRRGTAPIWRDFFARWNAQVAQGQREVEPFLPKPIPPFTPVLTERQEILQKQPDQS